MRPFLSPFTTAVFAHCYFFYEKLISFSYGILFKYQTIQPKSPYVPGSSPLSSNIPRKRDEARRKGSSVHNRVNDSR